MYEIERKFVLRSVPLGDFDSYQIRQAYLVGANLTTVRIRHIYNTPILESTAFDNDDSIAYTTTSSNKINRNDYYLTAKQGQGIRRIEHEQKISKIVFDNLWNYATSHKLPILIKERRKYHAFYDWDIDIINNLILAEIELKNELHNLEIPHILQPLLIKEVTDNASYTSYAIAKDGVVAMDEAAKRDSFNMEPIILCTHYRQDSGQCIIGCKQIQVDRLNVCPWDGDPTEDNCPCYE